MRMLALRRPASADFQLSGLAKRRQSGWNGGCVAHDEASSTVVKKSINPGSQERNQDDAPYQHGGHKARHAKGRWMNRESDCRNAKGKQNHAKPRTIRGQGQTEGEQNNGADHLSHGALLVVGSDQLTGRLAQKLRLS
jgi:hypothetical protein